MDEAGIVLDLDVIGALEGTDKSSSVASCWDYLRHYQTLFTPWRDEPINLIEIGVARGPSLTVWRKYFPRAQIVGIDVNPDCRHLAGDRVVIEIGSQEDPGFLHQVCAKYPPSIIIDDGSHQAHHIVYSFRHLFPMLQPGGLYVVEDLELHFQPGEQWAGNKTVSAPEYFLELARARMAGRVTTGEVWGDDRYIRDHVDAISLIGGAVAILKRKPRDIAQALACAEQHLRSIGTSPGHSLRLAQYILRHNGPPDYAERVVRDAISSGGPTQEALRWLSEALSRQGRTDDAAEVASEATRQWPDDHAAWAWLAQIERQRGNAGEAIAALERAASLLPQMAVYHEQLGFLLERQGEVGRALAATKKAALLHPEYEPWQRRVADLEKLAAVREL